MTPPAALPPSRLRSRHRSRTLPSTRLLARTVRIVAGVGITWLLQSIASAGVPSFQVVTEELPPYNMTIGGKLTGVATEVVEAVMKEAGLEARFQSMPWARAYELARTGESVLIYSMTWSQERRSLFKWVGVVAPSETWLYSAAGRPLVLTRLEDARFYRIATVNQDVGERYLLAKGFTFGGNLMSSTSNDLALEKLPLQRVDLLLSSEQTARWQVRQSGRRPDDVLFRSLRVADLDNDGLYMAFSARTPDALVERCRQALDAIHRNGTFDAIQRKWQ